MKIELEPIAFVRNIRKEVKDDDWAEVISEIVLADNIPSEAFDGIEDFSHLAILFYFHELPEEKAMVRSRHPRNNSNWPKIGTFAQRNKSRINRLGLTNVELIRKENDRIFVKYLDAIDGTPVLDIKPIMREFQPKGEIIQPSWSNELMKNYW